MRTIAWDRVSQNVPSDWKYFMTYSMSPTCETAFNRFHQELPENRIVPAGIIDGRRSRSGRNPHGFRHVRKLGDLYRVAH